MESVAVPVSSGRLTAAAAPPSTPVRRYAASPAGPDSTSAAAARTVRRAAAADSSRRAVSASSPSLPVPRTRPARRSRAAGSTWPVTTGTIVASHSAPGGAVGPGNVASASAAPGIPRSRSKSI